MGLLEDALRDVFVTRAGEVPALDNIAGQAMNRARRVRRRRRWVTTTAVFVTVLVLGVGVGVGPRLYQERGGDVFGAGSAGRPAVDRSLAGFADVLEGEFLDPAEGGRISLAGIPMAEEAWRISTGWLVETIGSTSGTQALWLVTPGQSPVRLIEATALAVGVSARPRARQALSWPPPTPVVTWSSFDRTWIASIVGGGLVGTMATSGAGTLRPVGVVGDGVLLSGSGDSYDMWFSDRGKFIPGPRLTQAIIGVSGTSDAVFTSSNSCLAQLEPVGWTPVATTCGVRVASGDRVWSSVDEHWLAVASGSALRVYDLATVWSKPTPAATWKLAVDNLIFLSDGSMAVGTESSVYRISVADPRQLDQPDRPLASTGKLRLVGDLRH